MVLTTTSNINSGIIIVFNHSLGVANFIKDIFNNLGFNVRYLSTIIFHGGSLMFAHVEFYSFFPKIKIIVPFLIFKIATVVFRKLVSKTIDQSDSISEYVKNHRIIVS
jgi:hypothetical protein